MFARVLLGMCLLSPLAASAKSDVCDNPVNDAAGMECMSAEIAKADAKLALYLAAAKKRITQDATTRTAAIWSAYLTFMDSTPPILPKP